VFKLICLNCGNESTLINVEFNHDDEIQGSNETIIVNARGVDYGSAFIEIVCEKCGNKIGQ